MIFVDSNVPMYVVGADHPNKDGAREALRVAAIHREHLVTDAEVLQEILHRYSSINRRDAIEKAMAAIVDVVEDVFPMERADVELAREIVLTTRLSARDAVHVAVMRRRGIDRIMTFDRGFDELPGIVRYTGR